MNDTQTEMQENTMRLNLSDVAAMLRSRLMLSLFAPMLLILSAQGASAACVKRAGFQEKFVEMSMGRILIPNDLRRDAVIAEKEFTIPISAPYELVFFCGPGGGSATGSRLQSAQSYGNNIYSTNVPGVGIRLSRRMSDRAGKGEWLYYPHTLNFQSNSDPTFYPPSYFRVELIKIAEETGSGPLSSGIYTQFVADGGGGSVLTTQLTGQGITIITPSCTVNKNSKNILVNFGKVVGAEFRGKGSTAAERKLDIQLDCKPGLNIQNTILIRLDAVSDPSGEKGVLKITPEAGAATGVGIQLINAKSQPVQFGEDEIVGPSKQGSYVLSYIARYFQVSEKIRSGRAAGVATFSVEYK